MKSYLPSMSGIERAWFCPASQLLPHDEGRRGQWEGHGRVVHKFLQDSNRVGRDEALELAPWEKQEALATIETGFLTTLDSAAFVPEVAVALDVEAGTARELGRGKDREVYSLAKPNESVGTIDVLGLTEDAVVVYDYKTGWRHYDAVEENWQLLSYAIAAALAFNRSHAYIGIIRVPDHADPYFIKGELTRFQLEDGLERLRELNDRIADLRMAQLAGERLRVTTGEHCKFCPAVARCPAIARLQRRLTSGRGARLPELNEQNAHLYVEAVRRGEVAVEQLKEKLQAYAAVHPIDLGNGKAYGPYPFKKESINVEIAVPVLVEMLDPEAARDAVKITRAVTKERLEEGIRSYKNRNPGKKVVIKRMKAAVLEQLSQAHALKTTYSYPIGVHTPKAQELYTFVEDREGSDGQGQQSAEAGDEQGDASSQADGG